MADANSSINNNLVQNIYHNWGNGNISDIAELQALGLEVDNEDPLPENLANVGTMNCASKAIGNWIDPNICPCVVENCRNIEG